MLNVLMIVVAAAVAVIAYLRYLLSGRMQPHHPNLEGKLAVVTGSTSGCGREAALAFARMGARVIIISASAERCDITCEMVRKATGNPNVETLPLNLADLRDVERAAKELLSRHESIDILVCNAAIMAVGLARTKQGFEAVTGTNYLGHYHLTNLLLPAVTRASGRIVVYGSCAHWIPAMMGSGLKFDAITHPRHMFWLDIYSQSKLCMIHFGRELHRRTVDSGVKTYIVDPGAVLTGITRTFPYIIDKLWHILPIGRPAIEGAQCAIYCATAPEKELVNGGYYYDCKIAPLAAIARDDAVSAKLWQLSSEWVSPSHSVEN